MDSESIELDDDYGGIETPEREAWDAAREEACANCRI